MFAFNFAELGEEALQWDRTWFIPVVLRFSDMDDVLASWPQALNLPLRRMLDHESGPAKGGIPFTVASDTCTVYAVVSYLFSVGDGHSQ